MTILVTGFEPFGKHGSNPSAEVARRLKGETIGGQEVACAVLPVTVRGSVQELGVALAEHRPEIVLGLGLAGGRWGLSVERVAINVLDFRLPDNLGAQPADQPIAEDGPAAYFATVPSMRIAAAWREAGIPGYVSNSAGTYVCNEVMYALLHGAEAQGYRGGFIHLPYTPEQAAAERAKEPSMELDTMLRGVGIALEVCVDTIPR